METARDAEVEKTRAVVAANTRSQKLAGELEDLRSRYDMLYGENASALVESSEENERLVQQIESLRGDLFISQTNMDGYEVTQTVLQREAAEATSELQATRLKLAAAEEKSTVCPGSQWI